MKLSIVSIQFSPKIGDVQHNLAKIEHLIEKAVKKGAKFIILPEICDIGYEFNAIKELAETWHGR